jgi:enoyl-CoA hydratase/carnithine racemase
VAVVTADPRLLGGVRGRLALGALADELAGTPTMLCLDGAWPADVQAGTRAQLRSLAALTVGVGAPDDLAPLCDLTTDDRAALGAWTEQFGRTPFAAVTAAILLRSAPDDTWESLVAESSAYSLLQSGPEFQEWLAGGPPRVVDVDEGPRVRVEQHGDVTDVVLSRASRHNALDARTRDELHARLLELAAGDGPIVVRGDGPSFCSGGDLAEFGTAAGPVEAHVLRLARSLALLMHRLAPRLVVALHGACIGAGIELPAFARRVVAADDLGVRLPELALGLVPGAGGTVSIRRRVGRARLLQLLLTGAVLDAETARTWGLVDEVVPRDRLVDRAHELAKDAA